MRSDFNQILKSCRNFDRNAQQQMLDLLAPFLFSVCKRYERSHANVQDLVQEALILIFNNMDQYRGDEKTFLFWCRRIAINVCLQKFRKKNLIMSLWQVPDLQTQELMTVFYQKWLEEKLTVRQALKAAQEEMQRRRYEPFYWAGFVLVE